MKVIAFLAPLLITSCSFFGIQNEEGPKYKVIIKEKDFEVREYEPYIITKTTIKGNFDDSSGDAFRILAGYIFGKNKGEKKISMTSPVEVQERSKSTPKKIAMTSPVEMSQDGDSYTMAFSMPSKYKREDLPEPLDDRITFEEVPKRLVATHQFSWLSSKEKNDRKAKELREWLNKFDQYKTSEGYRYAGFNPPWTIPFFRRNEVHIDLSQNNIN